MSHPDSRSRELDDMHHVRQRSAAIQHRRDPARMDPGELGASAADPTSGWALRLREWKRESMRLAFLAVLAIGAAMALAFAMVKMYAEPQCMRASADQHMAFVRFDLPTGIGALSGSNPDLSGTCVMADSSGSQRSVYLHTVQAGGIRAFLASTAMEMEVTLPFLFIALILLSPRGRPRR